MTTIERVIVVAGGAVLAVILLATFVMALLGKDLAAFDRYKTASPKTYKNLKSSCRFIGPLVAAMSLAWILATPLVAVDPAGGIPLAMGSLIAFSIFLWLSVRWFLWSLRS